MPNHAMSWVGPMTVGAALMYLFDPRAGRRRRALLRDQAVHMSRKTGEASGKIARDLQNRAAGVAAAMRSRGEEDAVDDSVLEARVRSALGRVCSHPGAIGVACIGGVVELVGPILANEYDGVWRAVTSVSGIVEVIDNLVLHETANSVPGLQGEGTVTADTGWSSTTRMLAVVGGAGLIAYGLRERTAIGGLAAAAGAGLVAPGFNDRALDSVLDQLRLPQDDGASDGGYDGDRLMSGRVRADALGDSAAVL